jgi:hypothetical protein
LFSSSAYKAVTLPPKITVIPNSLFEGSGITEIVIPNSVTRIELLAVDNCKKLTAVTIPESVTEIGEYAFSNCPELTTVNLPSHPIQYAGSDVFLNCPKLTLAMRKTITDTGYAGNF